MRSKVLTVRPMYMALPRGMAWQVRGKLNPAWRGRLSGIEFDGWAVWGAGWVVLWRFARDGKPAGWALVEVS